MSKAIRGGRAGRSHLLAAELFVHRPIALLARWAAIARFLAAAADAEVTGLALHANARRVVAFEVAGHLLLVFHQVTVGIIARAAVSRAAAGSFAGAFGGKLSERRRKAGKEKKKPLECDLGM